MDEKLSELNKKYPNWNKMTREEKLAINYPKVEEKAVDQNLLKHLITMIVSIVGEKIDMATVISLARTLESYNHGPRIVACMCDEPMDVESPIGIGCTGDEIIVRLRDYAFFSGNNMLVTYLNLLQVMKGASCIKYY